MLTHTFKLVEPFGLQGDLQSYIFSEFFPQHEDEGRDEWWHHVKTNAKKVLFILDGLDELALENRGPIDMLLKGNLLDKVVKKKNYFENDQRLKLSLKTGQCHCNVTTDFIGCQRAVPFQSVYRDPRLRWCWDAESHSKLFPSEAETCPWCPNDQVVSSKDILVQKSTHSKS